MFEQRTGIVEDYSAPRPAAPGPASLADLTFQHWLTIAWRASLAFSLVSALWGVVGTLVYMLVAAMFGG